MSYRRAGRAVLVVLLALLGFAAPAQAADLTTTVNNDRSVDLTLSDGPGNWWFRIESWGTCTAATGTGFNNIRGYAPGTYSVWAYADGNCGSQIAASAFTIPTTSLATTVHSDQSVDLTLSGGPNDWWFRINAGGTCTPATGTTFSNIRGYAPGTYSVWAYADSGCGSQIAASAFTIPTASLTATVHNDQSVDLTLSGGPNNWWFRINAGGTCTPATGTTFSNIRGYAAGTHSVSAYSDNGCNFHLAASSFTIVALPIPATPASVTVTRANGTLTASGYTVANATKYHITYTVAGSGNWMLAAPNHTESAITISGLDNAKTYVVAVRAGNANGWGGWRNSSAIPPYHPPTLTTTDETATGATLTLSNYDGTWYYHAEAAAGGASAQAQTCTGPVNGGQTTISGLDPNTQYTSPFTASAAARPSPRATCSPRRTPPKPASPSRVSTGPAQPSPLKAGTRLGGCRRFR